MTPSPGLRIRGPGRRVRRGRGEKLLRFLVTGTAGFIGFHLARRLLAEGHEVAGIDGMTPYYDLTLKQARTDILRQSPAFVDHVQMLENAEGLDAIARGFAPDVVLHLAAQAGVRYSLEHPRAYIDANLVGTFNVLEQCRRTPVKHLLLASTSSVYGANADLPFVETQKADTPLSLYAATKKATEAMSHCYAHLFAIPTTVFRFFTVYGPWGRPDMALFKFVESMLADRPIDLYNRGRMKRDFTYIDDLVECVLRLVDKVPALGAPALAGDSLSPVAPHRVVNIGGGQPIELLDFVEEIERALGRKARCNLLDMQPGDVPCTTASPALLEALIGYHPRTPVSDGVREFVAWYRAYHGA
jgi:UDP-glucuronate 4-epimerase